MGSAGAPLTYILAVAEMGSMQCASQKSEAAEFFSGISRNTEAPLGARQQREKKNFRRVFLMLGEKWAHPVSFLAGPDASEPL